MANREAVVEQEYFSQSPVLSDLCEVGESNKQTPSLDDLQTRLDKLKNPVANKRPHESIDPDESSNDDDDDYVEDYENSPSNVTPKPKKKKQRKRQYKTKMEERLELALAYIKRDPNYENSNQLRKLLQLKINEVGSAIDTVNKMQNDTLVYEIEKLLASITGHEKEIDLINDAQTKNDTERLHSLKMSLSHNIATTERKLEGMKKMKCLIDLYIKSKGIDRDSITKLKKYLVNEFVMH